MIGKTHDAKTSKRLSADVGVAEPKSRVKLQQKAARIPLRFEFGRVLESMQNQR